MASNEVGFTDEEIGLATAPPPAGGFTDEQIGIAAPAASTTPKGFSDADIGIPAAPAPSRFPSPNEQATLDADAARLRSQLTPEQVAEATELGNAIGERFSAIQSSATPLRPIAPKPMDFGLTPPATIDLTPEMRQQYRIDPYKDEIAANVKVGSNPWNYEYERAARENFEAIPRGIYQAGSNIIRAIESLPPIPGGEMDMGPEGGGYQVTPESLAETRAKAEAAQRERDTLAAPYLPAPGATGEAQAIEGLTTGMVQAAPTMAVLGPLGAPAKAAELVKQGLQRVGLPFLSRLLGGVTAAGVGAAEFGAATAVPEAAAQGSLAPVAAGAAHPFAAAASMAKKIAEGRINDITTDEWVNAGFLAVGGAMGARQYQAELAYHRARARWFVQELHRADPAKAAEVRAYFAAGKGRYADEMNAAFDDVLGKAAPEAEVIKPVGQPAPPAQPPARIVQETPPAPQPPSAATPPVAPPTAVTPITEPPNATQPPQTASAPEAVPQAAKPAEPTPPIRPVEGAAGVPDRGVSAGGGPAIAPVGLTDEQIGLPPAGLTDEQVGITSAAEPEAPISEGVTPSSPPPAVTPPAAGAVLPEGTPREADSGTPDANRQVASEPVDAPQARAGEPALPKVVDEARTPAGNAQPDVVEGVGKPEAASLRGATDAEKEVGATTLHRDALTQAVHAEFPELAIIGGTGKARDTLGISTADRLRDRLDGMDVREPGRDHARLLGRALIMDREHDVAGGMVGVPASSLNTGDRFMLGRHAGRVVSANEDGTVTVALDQPKLQGNKAEQFIVPGDKSVPMNKGSLERNPKPPHRTGEGTPPPPDKPTKIEREKDEPSPPTVTSQRRVDLNRDMAWFNRAELDSPTKRRWKELHEKALTDFTPESTDTLVSELAASGRIATDQEIAAMNVRLVELKNERKALRAELAKATDRSTITDLEVKIDRVADQAEFVMATSALTGGEAARALAARRFSLNDDLDIVAVLNRAKGRKAAALTAEEKADFEKRVEMLEAKNKAIEKQLEAMKEKRGKQGVERAKREARTTRISREINRPIEELVADVERLLKAGCH